jgi:diguanylate cyclase (GGDEF)-like protein
MPKVLLVEDNEMNRDMLSRRLTRRGFEVIVAVDGQQGIEIATRELPDIILMDMSLPVLDGWEASRLLKSSEATRSIPLVALTAHAMSDDRDRAMAAGCDDYDTKPVDLPRLLAKLDRLMVGKTERPRREPISTEALGDLRHKLKTSFNQILGYTEILLEELENSGFQEIAPVLGELHTNSRSLLERIQKVLGNDGGVSLERLEALAFEVGPEVEQLCQLSGSITNVLRGRSATAALADGERISSALRLLRSVLRQMCSSTAADGDEPSSGAVSATPEKDSSAVQDGAGRLLIVEDDAANRNLLRRRLVRFGYSVEVAEDGPSALLKISQAQYDLVLLDQMMPGMSGLDLLKLLRATYSANELPVIMVTAVDQSEKIVEALDQGANDYVAKPVDMPVVMARIQAQLARSKADRHTKLSDPLTGLSNRLLLSARLAEAIARPRDPGAASLAILLLDLDGFKIVNDSFGHAAGDRLLLEVAERMKSSIAKCELTKRATIARIGGDEFVILIERLDHANQPQQVAAAVLECLAQPIQLHGLSVTITGSIGIVSSTDEHVSPEHLLRDADLAMYRAKELGKNRWQMFDLSLRERVQTRMATAIELRHAVERGELLAVYQPMVHLQTRTILGFEVLLRWQHPERGLLPPAEFISVAEETGLIIPIGQWIIGQACRQLQIWQNRFPACPPLTMNVNVSVKQLKDPNLLAHVQRILAETGISPESLQLELTESAVISELESAKDVLAKIQALRVGLKLDDFGTGYSSLSYLRTLHFDSLKIDRSFVERLASDPESRAIVETIMSLAGTLRMKVDAEGIETEPQLGELIKLGCATGQGYLFSKPIEAEAAEKLLEASLDMTSSVDQERTWALPAAIGRECD